MDIIVAPHPDDEIIGCYEILKEKKPVMIIYNAEVEASRREETTTLKDFFNITAQLFLNQLPSHLITKENTLYFPDPIYETHPLHRFYGMQGEALARSGANIIFYTTNMQAPYIHEVKDTVGKENALNNFYSSQKSLWEYEKKYILFEGRCKWIF